jgi:hypothetical protein
MCVSACTRTNVCVGDVHILYVIADVDVCANINMTCTYTY